MRCFLKGSAHSDFLDQSPSKYLTRYGYLDAMLQSTKFWEASWSIFFISPVITVLSFVAIVFLASHRYLGGIQGFGFRVLKFEVLRNAIPAILRQIQRVLICHFLKVKMTFFLHQNITKNCVTKMQICIYKTMIKIYCICVSSKTGSTRTIFEE